jgi:hypothetical protein
MGSLSGIATLRREGDVEVLNSDSHKVITSSFSVGPLQLEVSKSVSVVLYHKKTSPLMLHKNLFSFL